MLNTINTGKVIIIFKTSHDSHLFFLKIIGKIYFTDIIL